MNVTPEAIDDLKVAGVIDAAQEHRMRQNAATAAVDLVTGERQQSYGHPSEDFERQALIWTGILRKKLAPGCSIDAKDIALCMIGVKLARESHKHKADNIVDIHGYAKCLEMVVNASRTCATCDNVLDHGRRTLDAPDLCEGCANTSNKPNWEARV